MMASVDRSIWNTAVSMALSMPSHANCRRLSVKVDAKRQHTPERTARGAVYGLRICKRIHAVPCGWNVVSTAVALGLQRNVHCLLTNVKSTSSSVSETAAEVHIDSNRLSVVIQRQHTVLHPTPDDDASALQFNSKQKSVSLLVEQVSGFDPVLAVVLVLLHRFTKARCSNLEVLWKYYTDKFPSSALTLKLKSQVAAVAADRLGVYGAAMRMLSSHCLATMVQDLMGQELGLWSISLHCLRCGFVREIVLTSCVGHVTGHGYQFNITWPRSVSTTRLNHAQPWCLRNLQSASVVVYQALADPSLQPPNQALYQDDLLKQLPVGTVPPPQTSLQGVVPAGAEGPSDAQKATAHLYKRKLITKLLDWARQQQLTGIEQVEALKREVPLQSIFIVTGQTPDNMTMDTAVKVVVRSRDPNDNAVNQLTTRAFRALDKCQFDLVTRQPYLQERSKLLASDWEKWLLHMEEDMLQARILSEGHLTMVTHAPEEAVLKVWHTVQPVTPGNLADSPQTLSAQRPETLSFDGVGLRDLLVGLSFYVPHVLPGAKGNTAEMWCLQDGSVQVAKMPQQRGRTVTSSAAGRLQHRIRLREGATAAQAQAHKEAQLTDRQMWDLVDCMDAFNAENDFLSLSHAKPVFVVEEQSVLQRIKPWMWDVVKAGLALAVLLLLLRYGLRQYVSRQMIRDAALSRLSPGAAQDIAQATAVAAGGGPANGIGTAGQPVQSIALALPVGVLRWLFLCLKHAMRWFQGMMDAGEQHTTTSTIYPMHKHLFV